MKGALILYRDIGSGKRISDRGVRMWPLTKERVTELVSSVRDHRFVGVTGLCHTSDPNAYGAAQAKVGRHSLRSCIAV